LDKVLRLKREREKKRVNEVKLATLNAVKTPYLRRKPGAGGPQEKAGEKGGGLSEVIVGSKAQVGEPNERILGAWGRGVGKGCRMSRQKVIFNSSSLVRR